MPATRSGITSLAASAASRKVAPLRLAVRIESFALARIAVTGRHGWWTAQLHQVIELRRLAAVGDDFIEPPASHDLVQRLRHAFLGIRELFRGNRNNGL
jgi:hypothetical protein